MVRTPPKAPDSPSDIAPRCFTSPLPPLQGELVPANSPCVCANPPSWHTTIQGSERFNNERLHSPPPRPQQDGPVRRNTVPTRVGQVPRRPTRGKKMGEMPMFQEIGDEKKNGQEAFPSSLPKQGRGGGVVYLKPYRGFYLLMNEYKNLELESLRGGGGSFRPTTSVEQKNTDDESLGRRRTPFKFLVTHPPSR